MSGFERNTALRWLPALAPLVFAGALFAFTGSERAVGLALVGLALGILIALGVPVQRWVGLAIDMVVRVLSTAVGAGLFVLLIIPAWLWAKLRRSDPLALPRRQSASATDLGTGSPVLGGKRSISRQLVFGVGAATLILTANFFIGWTWDAMEEQEADEVTSLTPRTAPIFQGETAYDPRSDGAAMAKYPWRDQYFSDIQRTLGGYWPFTENRPFEFSSEYVNLDGWVRKSYEPKESDEGLPSVWMFGGSTTWGEGQRDEYTIASWLSRIAEDAGLPIAISNYGQRGWTHFQEMILFEQQAAKHGGPEFAMFYDGANEISSQSFMDEAVPTHGLASQFAETLYGTRITTQAVEPVEAITWTTLTSSYKEHSAAHKIFRLFRSEVAGADIQPESEYDDGINNGGEVEQDGLGFIFDMTEQDGVDAGQVYERGKRLTQLIAEEADTEALFFWQPMKYKGPPQQRAIDQLTPPTVDITDSLDGNEQVYIDGGHTNEEGARIVAEAIWTHLEPQLQLWYEDNK